ncbi:GDSL lipase/esterase [Dillenia turbinata]|uniref:GDSL lipase/esterase n=1 Tax=Dillenia turbinata TaxID=194707 RepID=A0AAN8UVA3_9MAGN
MIFSLLIFSFFFHNALAIIPLPRNQSLPALIVFGDSIVDPGNNNNLLTVVKCNFPPYGKDFVDGKATGRFSNGRIPSDLIAEELSIKELVPAYLDPNLQVDDLLTGVSFASGATGYDPLTSKIASVLSLSDQLNMFKEYTRKITEAVGEDKKATIISKSLYIVCVGSDDIANTYFATPARKFDYGINDYTDLMVTFASKFLKDLYGLGARRVAIINIPPIGCVPSQRTLGGGLERGCAESHNHAAMLFNSKLSLTVDLLNKKLPQARLVVFDIYKFLMALLQNHAKYGFEVVNNGCCGTGVIEVSILCNKLTPFTCKNDRKYLFWDSYHPTEEAYRILVHQVLKKYINKFF